VIKDRRKKKDCWTSFEMITDNSTKAVGFKMRNKQSKGGKQKGRAQGSQGSGRCKRPLVIVTKALIGCRPSVNSHRPFIYKTVNRLGLLPNDRQNIISW